MLKKWIFFSLTLWGSLSAADFNQPLSLGELVDIALENHPTTKKSWWNAKRAAAAVGIEKSNYYPKLDLKIGAIHGRDFKFLNGPNTNYTILGADIFLSMMLWDFGSTKAGVEAAKNGLIAANWSSDWKLQEIMLDVLEQAYQTLHAEDVVAAARFSLEDAERMLNLATEQYQAGVKSVSDLYIAKATHAQMKIDLMESQIKLAIHRGKLAASLGLEPTTSLQITPMGDPQPIISGQIECLTDLAQRQRADLFAKRAQLQEAIALEKKVRSSFLPKLDLGGKGGANHALHDKTNAMQYNVSVNLTYPIFTGFNSLYQKRTAMADVEISRADLVQLELDIAVEVLTYSLTVQGLQEMMPAAQEELQNALKSYEAVLEIYKAGKDDISSVSIQQRQLSASRIRYSEMKTRWFVALAKLAYATGTLCSEIP